MENETAIKAAKSIASAVSGFDIEDTSVKKETGKSITLTQTLPDNKRRQYVQAANKLLSSKSEYDFIEVTSNRATKDFKFRVSATEFPLSSVLLLDKSLHLSGNAKFS